MRSLRSGSLPDIDRLSILTAMILLGYALARFVNLPSIPLQVQLPGIFIQWEGNVQLLVAALVAGMAALGTDWLVREHPRLTQRSTVEHWLLPALTAGAIGAPLFQLPLGLTWWFGYAAAGVFLLLVFIAEYIVADPADPRQPLAAAGLTALAYALFLALAVTLRIAEVRLFLMMPVLALAGSLVSLRTLHLRLYGQWAYTHSLLIGLILAQLVAGLHYWPLPPVSYGLAILGPAYALTSLAARMAQGQPLRRNLIEPVVVLFLVWIVAWWIE